jgi:hypothetical protein
MPYQSQLSAESFNNKNIIVTGAAAALVDVSRTNSQA